MTGSPDRARPTPTPPRPRKHGLALRLWVGVLVPPLAAAAGLAATAFLARQMGHPLDPQVVLDLSGAAVLGMAVALVCGMWLTGGLTRGLRHIDDALATGHAADPPSGPTPRWGEIGPISDAVRDQLDRLRRLSRAETELRDLQGAIAGAYGLVDRWHRTERWAALGPNPGNFGALTDTLDHGFARLAEVGRQNLQAAELIRSDVARALDEARASAELAERGYVEATALMTTVREIVRLASEIRQVADAGAPAEPEQPVPVAPPPAPAPDTLSIDWREQAAQALEELVQRSSESVDDLGQGLLGVQDIGEQVQLLSNRATLIALNALATAGAEAARPEVTAELKQLALDVRAATDRVQEMSALIGDRVRLAGDRMREARARVLERLEALPESAPPAAAAFTPPPAPTPAPPPPAAAMTSLLAQWIERLREMAQDATRKGERLTESQEGAAGAAQRVVRALDEETQDLEGLVVRLSPIEVDPLAPGDAASASPRRLSVIAPAGAPPARGPGGIAQGREGGA